MIQKKTIQNKVTVSLIIGFFLVITMMTSSAYHNNNEQLTITVDHHDINTMMITTCFPDVIYSTVSYDDVRFARLDIDGCGFHNVVGEAKLPMLRRMIEIPQGAVPSISVELVDWELNSLSNLGLPERIIPVQPPKEKHSFSDDSVMVDEQFYQNDSFFPQTFASVRKIGQIRERRFALVEIAPVLYQPTTGKLQLMRSCQIKISLSHGDLTKTLDLIHQYSNPSFEPLFEQLYLNYGFYEQLSHTDRNQEGYLIIVDDAFYDEIVPFADWKSNLGFDTTATKTSDIPGGPTANNIKNYIQDAFYNWAIPPAYVLLVGDTPQIPAFTGSVCGTETDSYYATMDGDIFPDLYISRFPASTEAQVSIMVDKTMYYEQGDFPSNEWIKKGAFIASDDQGQLAEDTHEYVMTTHLEPNGYSCDRIYESTGGDTDDISTALNDGRSLCIYSGHGSPSGWACVPFYQSDVNSLVNDGMYPFVCSHACSTNTYEDGECFGETWLRVQNKGSIAFWGSSCSTYWDEDDVIERRVFDAWWYDGLDRIGQMTDKGMYDSYMQNPGLEIERFMESYNVMGDSSVKIWSDDPFVPEHDIQMEQINVDDMVPFDETQNVTGIVRNVGNNTEQNIIVDFIEDGVVLSSKTIPVLDSMQQTSVSFSWHPPLGNHTLELVSRPIPDEYNVSNNNVNKTVSVIASPAIQVTPSSLVMLLPTDATATDTITIRNGADAHAPLNFSLSYDGDYSGNWLSANPDEGTLGIDESVQVTITADSTGFAEGEYQGSVIVESNDLNDPEWVVSVDITVVFGDDMEVVGLNQPTGVISHGSHVINATIRNLGFYNQTDVVVNCSIYAGFLDYFQDFEVDNGNYSAEGTPDWEWGNPTSGPSSAYSGSFCWATDLDGDYSDDASAMVDSVPIYLPNGVSSELSFWHWYDTEDGYSHYDGGNVKISTDGGLYWQVLGEYLNPYPIEFASDNNEGIPHEPCFGGSSSGWQLVTFDLSDFAGETVQFRWHFGSDISVNKAGWYIDDVTVGFNYGRDGNQLVYSDVELVDINAYQTQDVLFSPDWTVNQNGFYTVQIQTHLPDDENTLNDEHVEIVEVFQDVSAPVIAQVLLQPNPQLVNESVNISCIITDETMVSTSSVLINGPPGFTTVNVSMTAGEDDTYFYEDQYGIIGNYSVIIHACDSLGNNGHSSTYTFRIVDDSFISCDISFVTGWNLITLPMDMGWNASDLAAQITGCTSISGWNATSQTYQTYIVGGPPSFDFSLIGGHGYFVDVNQQSMCTFTGVPLYSVNVSLSSGWNLIGWFKEENTTASSLAGNITGCSSVSSWNTTTQSYETYIVGGPPSFDFTIVQSMGLFVDVTEESYWHGEG